MTDKIGRNLPCPCGSGRKYKNCCYRRDAEAAGGRARSFSDPEWLLMRRTEGEIVNAVGRFLPQHFGADAVARAWDEFSAGSTIAGEHLQESIFIPWLVFSWCSVPAQRGPAGHEPLPVTPALAYLAECGDDLDEYQREFILAACREPFTFFVVTAVEPCRSLTLQDLLLEREILVKERKATETLSRGHVIFARSVTLSGQSILLGVAPVPLPPDVQGHIFDLRDEIKKQVRTKGKLDPAMLLSLDDMLRGFYFDAADRVLNPPLPVLQNTDGDPLVPIRLKYTLACSPQQALDSLKSLVLPEFQEEILDDADFDAAGELVRASLTWQKRGNKMHPEWRNTSLGNINIDGERLEVEVNSEKRAAKIRSELRKHLGNRCMLVEEKRESAESLLQAARDRRDSGGGRRPAELHGHAVPPEFRNALKAQMKAHWDAWPDIPLPALKNQTPREAARTPRGRERLEALLIEFEHRNKSIPQPELRPDVAELRRKLGLEG